MDGKITKTVTRKGIYLGKEDAFATEVYKGIPYACPPVDALRWLPPQELPDNYDVHEAFEFSPIPPQESAGKYADMPQSEDCLYLNIWTNRSVAADKAVLVWNYGGSFIKGGTRNPDFDGSLLVSEYPDIVFVTINHRLGLLANLNLSALDAEGKYAASNNLAQLDLHFALKWVYENISAFGGSPEKITVFGHSSGSSNISAQLLLADPVKYFKRAVMHSSFAYDVGTTSLESSRMIAEKAFALMGNPTMKELLQMPVKKLMEVQHTLLQSKFSTDVKPFSVVIDGNIIPKDAHERLKGLKGYAFIIGSALGEYDQQFRRLPTLEEKYNFLKSQIGERCDLDALISEYRAHDPARTVEDVYMDIKNDFWIRVPGNIFACSLSENNPVYMFYTEAVDHENGIRAPHGNEYLADFGHPDLRLYDETSVRAMRNMLVNFVRFGVPECDGTEGMRKVPVWPAYSRQQMNTLCMSDTPHIVEGVRTKDLEAVLHCMEQGRR